VAEEAKKIRKVLSMQAKICIQSRSTRPEDRCCRILDTGQKTEGHAAMVSVFNPA